MTPSSTRRARLVRVLVTILVLAGLVWGGARLFSRAPQPELLAAEPGDAPEHTALAEARVVPVLEEAVGTIRSRTRVQVAPQVAGQIVSLTPEAGDAVKEGDLVAVLEDHAYGARLEQARSKREAARAAAEEAGTRLARTRTLFESEAATREELEAAEAAAKRAEAELRAAEQAVRAAEIEFGHTRIRAPITGLVAARLAEPGDLAWPGKPLLEIYDPAALRLEASIREGLFGAIAVGDELEVRIASLDVTTRGRVAEIVPAADPRSRSFLVRVDLPHVEGLPLYPGMFGRLLVPHGEREVVVVPREAVEEVGELRTVLCEREGTWRRRFVTLGPTLGERVEVLSGLVPGERIGWNGAGAR